MPSKQGQYIADSLRAAAALLRPGLREGEAGWWCCSTVLAEHMQEADAGLPGMWYSAFGDFDQWLHRDVPVGNMHVGPGSFDRQCLRFMYLELLACIAETDDDS